jgi:Phasin protein
MCQPFEHPHALCAALGIDLYCALHHFRCVEAGAILPGDVQGGFAEAPIRRHSMASQISKSQKPGLIDPRPAFVFQTVALKTVPAVALECADQAREWAEQSAAFLEQLVAAKTLAKAVEIQIAHSRNAVESLVTRGKKLRELYASLIKEAYRPVAA